ncbi:MAG: hypothetical protein ACRD68_07525 [Pyrinomonadaceae bacterium]
MRERDDIFHRGGRRRDNIHETPDVSHIRNPDVAYEHTDVSVGPIAKFVFGLFVFGLIVMGAVWGMFRYFDRREKAIEPPPSPLARQGKERLPPEPRLQMAPGFGVKLEDGREVDLSQTGAKPEWRIPQAEYRVLRQQWDDELNNYGWAAEQGPGVVRLPIEAAKKLYLQREAAKTQQQQQGTAPASGQQQQQQAPAAPGRANETLPSGSSSGRQAERRNQ